MTDYISREAVIDCIDKAYDYEYDLGDSRHNDMFKDMIEAIPSENVQPIVHGTWLAKEYMPGDPGVGIKDMWIERRAEQSDFHAYCSECKKDAGYSGEQRLILSKFCPNCGAKMDLED